MPKGLGKGLSALFGEEVAMLEPNKVRKLRLSEIEPNPNQPRKEFKEEALESLADSIREHGLLQPIIVREKDDGRFEIISGERRWRASRMAKLTIVDAVVLDADDVKSGVLALVENLQREDLNPMEEALGYSHLMTTSGMTQEETARLVGKSRPAVANSLRLLTLPEHARDLVADGDLSEGHAKVLLSLSDADKIDVLADRCVSDGISVRELEKIVKNIKNEEAPKEEVQKEISVNYYNETAKAVSEQIGRKVQIKNGRRKGTVTIEYYGDDDLNELLKIFGK